MTTLKDIDAAFSQSIGTLYNLWYAVDYERNCMEFEEAEDFCQGPFLIGLDNLIEAIWFLEHKRHKIRKMMDDKYDLKRRGDHMDKIVEFEGQKYIWIETDGRYVCKYSLIEMVNYCFLISNDGKHILVPVGIDRIPAVVCGLD